MLTIVVDDDGNDEVEQLRKKLTRQIYVHKHAANQKSTFSSYRLTQLQLPTSAHAYHHEDNQIMHRGVRTVIHSEGRIVKMRFIDSILR